jgi:pimeloyl-ACP methyl ester carboxylesterase
MAKTISGYSHNGLPYNRLGDGPLPLVVFEGLTFEHSPQASVMSHSYEFLAKDYTVYVVLRRPDPPAGYTLKDMANDYAVMIREEFKTAMDVIGVSTGGSIVQHFAADHPELVKKLVIHSSAYTLNPQAKAFQLRIGQLGREKRWVRAYYEMASEILPRGKFIQAVLSPLVWVVAFFMGVFAAPKTPDDLAVTVEAEDKHDFIGRLAEIKAPTLVAAGEEDPFYSPELFRKTAAGIPNARLILYPKMAHPAAGKQFQQDVLAFLKG